MANLKASKQYIPVNLRNRLRNQSVEHAMKTAIKRVHHALEQKSKEAESVLRQALRLIDKTASKGVIKKQSAARKKSRLTQLYNQQAKG